MPLKVNWLGATCPDDPPRWPAERKGGNPQE